MTPDHQDDFFSFAASKKCDKHTFGNPPGGGMS
jgi:hypothetical protein